MKPYTLKGECLNGFKKTNMKYKLILIAAFIALAIVGVAQTTEKLVTGKSQPDTLDKFYSSEEVVVKIPASGSDWTHYLAKNLKSYVASENGAPSGRYTVMLSFVVDNDGTISDVKAENNPGYGTAEEAIRVMKNSPKWMPAQLNGRKIKYRAKNAITFLVSGD